MKMIIRPMLFVFTLMLFLTSCNNEELFVEDLTEVVTPNDPDGTTPEEDVDATNPNASLPCDFDLSTVQSGDTVVINCIMDLGGQSITLPSNVTIVYEGGDIINGILNFASDAVISGELLNSTLTLGGTKPQLKDPVFNFNPKRWGIVEGEVTQDIALRNSKIIHDIILMVKELGINTFSIDKLDAYFYQELSYEYIFLLPSDFHLKMTENTHLRVFPTNADDKGNLIMILNSENVTVTGGYLHGDRDAHDYSSGGTHEQGHLIKIKTGINVKIENVHMSHAIGDGLDVESYRFHSDPLYVGSSNILITGCTFDSNRRNNLSITEGRDIIVENCNFLNAGIATANSTGTAPRHAIDIEPDIHDYNNPRQRVDRVIIRNNTESGSVAGALIIFAGDDILVTGNSFEKETGISRAFNVKVINNPMLGGVAAGIPDIIDNRNYQVSGNTISKPKGSGIYASNPGVQIFDNKIINSKTGIQLQNLTNANIYNNTIESDQDGINVFGAGNNVKIYNNIINVNRPFFFQGVNAVVGKETLITDNEVNSTSFGYFQTSNGIKILGNNFVKGLRLESSTNILLQGNKFIFPNGNTTAINIRGEQSENIKILNNYIENSSDKLFGYEIYGEGNALWGGDKNIEISDNEFNSTGMNIRYYNGITCNNNKFTNGNINYEGNNSYFNNNRGYDGSIINHSIKGSNNVIIE